MDFLVEALGNTFVLKNMETKDIMDVLEKYVIEIDIYSMEYDVTNKRLLRGIIYDKEENHYEVKEGTKVICENVFKDEQFESIKLPNSLKIIEEKSFIYCDKLQKINFPEGLLAIKKEAFCGCCNIKTIYIPASVVELGDMAFYNCSSIESFKIDSNSNNYTFENGIIFSKDKRELILAIGSLIEENIRLPEGLLVINEGAFRNCQILKSIDLPSSIQKLGDFAFDSCINLQNIHLPKGLKSIGSNCFSHCFIENILIPSSIEYIGKMAFSACYQLKEIQVESNLNYVSKSGVLFKTKNECLINYPAGSYRKEYIIPQNVSEIEQGAFESCLNLEKVELPIGIKEIKKSTFLNCKELINVNIPVSVTIIKDNAFEGCCQITEIKLPNSLKMVEEKAFFNCINLKNINIPANLTNISFFAFERCDKLFFKVNPLNQKYRSYKGKLFQDTSCIYGINNCFYELGIPF